MSYLFLAVNVILLLYLTSEIHAFDLFRNGIFNKKEKSKPSDKIKYPSLYPNHRNSREELFNTYGLPGSRIKGDSDNSQYIFSKSGNLIPDHHQIYKRYLSRDSPFQSIIPKEPRMFGSSKNNNKRTQLQSNNIFDTSIQLSRLRGEAQKNMRDFVDKIVLNDKISMDDSGSFGRFHNGGLRTPNDTTKISSKDSFGFSSDVEKINEGYNQHDSNPENVQIGDCDVYFVDRSNDFNTVNHFSIDNLDRNKDGLSKREAIDESSNSSCETSSIKEEIDKVYKDISENVRLLSKLRDRESHLMKRPAKKRWLIVDNTIGELSNNNRGRRCSQELTVEMDTSKDATPDRLEHIERKVEEEVLQVNVPLKCNH